MNYDQKRSITLNNNSEDYTITVTYNQNNTYNFQIGDRAYINVSGEINGASLVAQIDGTLVKAVVHSLNDHFTTFVDGTEFEFKLPVPAYNSARTDPNSLLSPITGVVSKIEVVTGDRVEKGDPLLVIVAMKQQHIIRSPKSGTITEINCASDELVDSGITLVSLSD
eukprot:TRINITY_DN332_c0_g1_i3.p1 TRINITY_DN332_c0_g1~~TRINITY_DN332_c0_g1_i3.p1  ORF type:complete len:167 (+),score=33.10 TRINITY_DN332_c0_g1_i3:203-703(+)